MEHDNQAEAKTVIFIEHGTTRTGGTPPSGTSHPIHFKGWRAPVRYSAPCFPSSTSSTGQGSSGPEMGYYFARRSVSGLLGADQPAHCDVFGSGLQVATSNDRVGVIAVLGSVGVAGADKRICNGVADRGSA